MADIKYYDVMSTGELWWIPVLHDRFPSASRAFFRRRIPRNGAPTPRDYSFKLNRKEKRAALKSALTDKVQTNNLIVVDELKLDEIKTKNFVKVLGNLKVEKGLVVLTRCSLTFTPNTASFNSIVPTSLPSILKTDTFAI